MQIFFAVFEYKLRVRPKNKYSKTSKYLKELFCPNTQVISRVNNHDLERKKALEPTFREINKSAYQWWTTDVEIPFTAYLIRLNKQHYCGGTVSRNATAYTLRSHLGGVVSQHPFPVNPVDGISAQLNYRNHYCWGSVGWCDRVSLTFPVISDPVVLTPPGQAPRIHFPLVCMHGAFLEIVSVPKQLN